MTLAGENYVVSLLTKKTSALDAYYVALICNDPPSMFISGSNLDEPNVPEYQRVKYDNAPLMWSEPSGEVSNTEDVNWPTATEDWGTISHWAICDSPQDGNVLWAGDFPVPFKIEAGMVIGLPPGTLVLRTMSYKGRLSL